MEQLTDSITPKYHPYHLVIANTPHTIPAMLIIQYEVIIIFSVNNSKTIKENVPDK